MNTGMSYLYLIIHYKVLQIPVWFAQKEIEMGKRKVGGLWISFTKSAVERIKRILNTGSGAFTKAFPISILKEGQSKLALLSTIPGQVNYISLITAGIKISDIEMKVQIGPVIEFANPLPSEQLIRSIPSQLKRHASLLDDNIETIPPGTWN